MSHGRWLAMFLCLGMLGACSGRDDRKTQAQNDNGADVSLSVASDNAATAEGNGSGRLSLDLPGISGSVTLPKIKLHSDDVDIDGVRLAPGSSVTGIDIAGQEGTSEGSVTIRFLAPQAPREVQAYFLGAFKAKGVEAVAKGRGVAGTDHEGKPFTIDLSENGSGTRGVIRMGSRSG